MLLVKWEPIGLQLTDGPNQRRRMPNYATIEVNSGFCRDCDVVGTLSAKSCNLLLFESRKLLEQYYVRHPNNLMRYVQHVYAAVFFRIPRQSCINPGLAQPNAA
jgi:hypothetical protein